MQHANFNFETFLFSQYCNCILQAEDSVDDDVLNSFCWMYSSFDMPATFTFPCARRTSYDGTYLYNTYYQWVSIYLAFQAGLFYIPRCIWLIIEGGLMSYMVKGTVHKTFPKRKLFTTMNFYLNSWHFFCFRISIHAPFYSNFLFLFVEFLE